MNILQTLRASREFCVTLNRTEAIDPREIKARFTWFSGGVSEPGNPIWPVTGAVTT